jgi:hypothetical protein
VGVEIIKEPTWSKFLEEHDDFIYRIRVKVEIVVW